MRSPCREPWKGAGSSSHVFVLCSQPHPSVLSAGEKMLSRRGFLRQSFAFSALTGLGSLPAIARSPVHKPNAAARQLLLIGDWGYENLTAQTRVASAMQDYVKQHGLTIDAMLMLGDNWYGQLHGGASSSRWKTQFEDMYPSSIFNCPAYAIPGNHDYQRMPESK